MRSRRLMRRGFVLFSDIIGAVRIRSRLLLVPPALFLTLALGHAAWLGWHVNRDLSASVADVQRIQGAVESGDDSTVKVALADLRRHSSSAAERTDGPTWTVLTKLPVVGDDAAGVRLVSEVVADLSQDGLEPLVRTIDDLKALLPRNSRISIRAVRSMQRPVANGLIALEDADARLSSGNPAGYAERLATNYKNLANRVSDAAAVLRTAHTALTVMPGMLGDKAPRNYLLVFQNNAEIRATGGLPGAVSLVHAEDGKVHMARQVAAGSFGETPKPVLPLSAAELKIYHEQLGTYFLDANFTPDFPRTADLMKARWEQVYDEKLDGVLSIDPVALSYILKATGPVSIGKETLTSANAVDELLHEVYLRYPNPADQDAWFRRVARAVFDKVSSGAELPEELFRALVRGADERRLYVHSFHKTEQAALSGSEVAGELVTDPKAAPQVGVYLNDATGAKMSYYLRYDVRVDSTYCTDGVQGLSGKAQLLSDAPEDAASLPDYVTGAGRFGTERGSQLVLVRLYGPVGGSLGHVELNAIPIDVETVEQDRRPAATTVVLLKPQFTVDLTWRMTTGPGQTRGTDVSVTPGVTRSSSSSVAPSSCG